MNINPPRFFVDTEFSRDYGPAEMMFFCLNSCSRLVAVSFLLALLPQCSSGPSTDIPPPQPPVIVSKAPPPPSRPVFQKGDQLELFVKEDLTLNGSYVVREGGYIVIPRAGRVDVAGLTREEAEPRLKDFLQKTQLKEASVIIERNPGAGSVVGPTTASGQTMPRVLVYMTGSVPKAGGYYIPVPPGKSVGVYEALLISGGMSKFATLGKIEVFRFDSAGKRKKSTIDLRPIMKGEADDPPISEGDIINIPEKVFGF